MGAANEIWVVAETDGARLKEVTLEALGDARELADPLHARVSAVLFGSAGPELLSPLGHYGADRVLLARGGVEEARSAERCAGVLAQALDRDPVRLVLFGATLLGRDIACRLAAARHLALANDCNWVRRGAGDGFEAARAVYGRKLYARVRLATTPALASLRPGAAGLGKPAPRRPLVEQLLPLAEIPARVTQMSLAAADPRTLDITEAERIVAVGRGVGSRERVAICQQLADRLGAALAASRPLVDAGWMPCERQVGLTGRIVAPQLYIAAGISGASQHTLGMKGSECVVAINRDKNAEIFKLADLKVIADLEVLVPELLRRLEARTVR